MISGDSSSLSRCHMKCDDNDYDYDGDDDDDNANDDVLLCSNMEGLSLDRGR